MDLVAPQHMGSSQNRDKPMSSALAGRLLTTGPPGNLRHFLFACLCMYLSDNGEGSGSSLLPPKLLVC